MTRFKPARLVPLFLAIFAMSSCSGKKGGVICTVNCNNNGTGSVIVTVTSTPSQTLYFPYLEWEITSVGLIGNNNTAATIVAQGALPPTDFARLQTDSQFLGIAKTFPAGTYSSLQIQLKPSTSTSYFYNSSSNAVLGCAAGAVCPIPNTVAGFTQTTVTVPVSFSFSGNANTGFSINFDLSKAVTSAGGMTFDFTKTGAITLTKLPRTGQTTGLDSFQNFTGMVSATTSTSFDMFSLASATRTFTLAATVAFNDPFNVCKGAANFSCIALNQNLSVDADVNSDGTLTAYEVEFLDPAPAVVQECEGIIVAPVSNNQFKMVVTNGMPVTGFLTGTLVTVTVNSTSTYAVDPKNLFTAIPTGFASSSDLVVGQDVMLQGGSQDFTTNTLSGYTRTLLRYSSIGGTVTSPGANIFTLSGLSPFFASSTTNTVQVLTYTNTTYDNTTGIPVAATNASVRGLYLNPNSGATQPLLAAHVRAH